MRTIDKLIIHCSATRADWMQGAPTAEKVAEIKRWHVIQRGWSDIGYHLLIDRDGTVFPGRDYDRTGAHVKGHNTGSVGICLIGGHGSDSEDDFTEHFTPDQDRALRTVLATLQHVHPGATIHGHNEFAAKACPGFLVEEWLRVD